MPKPQKIKVFANANVVGLEKEMNTWLKSGMPPPVINNVNLTGWGGGGGAGEYTIVAVVLYE